MAMNKQGFQLLARLNKSLLPSLSKGNVDLTRLTSIQKALIAWRYWVTRNSLE